MTSIIIAAAQAATPQSLCTAHRRLNACWTLECTEAKKLPNKTSDILRRYLSYSNLEHFKRANSQGALCPVTAGKVIVAIMYLLLRVQLRRKGYGTTLGSWGMIMHPKEFVYRSLLVPRQLHTNNISTHIGWHLYNKYFPLGKLLPQLFKNTNSLQRNRRFYL